MPANSYKHISANTGGVAVCANACVLKRVTINTKGATSNLLTLFDNPSAASGNVIAAIDTTTGVDSLEYDVQCLTGLFAVLAAGTPADLTIVTG